MILLKIHLKYNKNSITSSNIDLIAMPLNDVTLIYYITRFISVTRVRTQGYCTVNFNVVTKDLKKMGYDCCVNSDQVSNNDLKLYDTKSPVT